MKLNRGRLNWGVFFIVLGAVPLAYRQGAVPLSTLSDAWRLWPLVLVGIGLKIVLSRTPAYFVGGLVVAACLGLVVGSLFAIGPQFGCGNQGGNASTTSRAGTFDGPAQVELDLQCGRASVTTSSDSQWHVTASDTGGPSPNVTSSAGSLAISSGSQDGWWPQRAQEDWDVALPSGRSIGLNVSVAAGDAHVGLGGELLTERRRAPCRSDRGPSRKRHDLDERRGVVTDPRRQLERLGHDLDERRVARPVCAESARTPPEVEREPGFEQLVERRPGSSRR